MRRIISFLALALLSACIYPYTQEIPDREADDKTLVVSGDIVIGGETRIHLGAVSPLGSSLSTTRDNTARAVAIVIERKSDGRFMHGMLAGRGTYIFDTQAMPDDDEYRLRIDMGDAQYETPFMKVLPAPDITSLDYVTDENYLHVRIGLDGGEGLSDYRWDYTETWEYHAFFVPHLMYVPRTGTENPSLIYREPTAAEDYYYCWNTADSTQPQVASTSGQSENRIKDLSFLSIPRSDPRLSVLYSLLVTARGLTPEGRAYLEYLNSTSNITGDLFTPVPSNMNGNLRCVSDSTRLAVGFVGVTRTASRRIFIGYEGVYRNSINPDYYLYYPEYDEEEHMYHFEDLYAGGDAPVYCSSTEVPQVPTKTNVQWAPKWCSDCRESGGTKNKPEWWPNNHR